MALSADIRPLLRIDGLPAEILTIIFKNVRGDFDSCRNKYPVSSTHDIKNIRLTCKQFCDASSRLLLHHLDISFTTSSIEHLVKVSHHPIISKGIQSLGIRLTFYDPVPAESLPSFIAKLVPTLQEVKATFNVPGPHLGHPLIWAAPHARDAVFASTHPP
ncbi:hypothetical protein F5883DRAFT_596249 [Diaporthe sp. PMI_573]|nr:hypothetical protein F5883DRAFT_596249 [Diaporthaceae sp. PMI_573]